MPDLLITAALVAFPVGWLTSFLIGRMLPLFRRYALARPNARSSHTVPTPQGAGLALLLAGVIAVAALGLSGVITVPRWTLVVGAGAIMMGLVGVIDDLRPLPTLPRLLLQFAAVGAVLALAPADWSLTAGAIPGWLEKTVAAVAGVWFVNLTNFMDGIDLITVADGAPVAAALVVFWMTGAIGSGSAILSLAMLGGLLGFTPANTPPARIFLGDVGSLPIGLVTAACLYDLACNASLAAAILLPLYPLTDATSTLLIRLARGENVFRPHRDHAYQRAVDRGRPVMSVLRTVGVLNLGLALLATFLVLAPDVWWVWRTGAVALGIVAVAVMIVSFRIGRPT